MVLSYDQKMIDALGIQESLNWIEEAKKEYIKNPRPAMQCNLKDKLQCLFYDLKARKAERKITESEMYEIFDHYWEKYFND